MRNSRIVAVYRYEEGACVGESACVLDSNFGERGAYSLVTVFNNVLECTVLLTVELEYNLVLVAGLCLL